MWKERREEKCRFFRIRDVGCSELIGPKEDIGLSRNIGQQRLCAVPEDQAMTCL